MKRKSKVFYVCFYSEKDNMDKIVSYPSVWSKIDYVASVIKNCGYDVEIVSEGTALNGTFHGYTKKVDEHERITYFTSKHFNNKFLQKFSIIKQWGKILFYLLKNVKRGDKVLVYNSIYNLRWLSIYRNLFGKKYSIEIEDVFSALTENAKRYGRREWRIFDSATMCICVNDLIVSKLKKNQHYIVSYGSYLIPPHYTRSIHKNVIRLVYAGVIERERNAAFLAVDAMQYLPDNYELNILGFGEEEDLEELKKQIAKTKKRVFYFGRLEGNSYYSFLQGCDIGLSTHMYNEKNIVSADNTFPSKVLVYISNGLPVVAQRLECLERSQVGECICYYNTPTPIEVADAIMRVDLSCDPREIVERLDLEFRNRVNEWLNNKAL